MIKICHYASLTPFPDGKLASRGGVCYNSDFWPQLTSTMNTLIRQLQENPERYIGSINVFALRAFADGYKCCLAQIGVNVDRTTQAWDEFVHHLETDGRRSPGSPTYQMYLAAYSDTAALHLCLDELQRCTVYVDQGYAQEQNGASVSASCDIFTQLDDVRRRIVMYLPFTTIEMLFAFSSGFSNAAITHPSKSDMARANLEEFERWLCNKYELQGRCRWDRLILVHSNFDQGKALPKFFEELDCFREHSQSES
ncbi:MAG TPA: hypothetical protein VN048_01845 [Verrucomicrobiae bacterium]|jgi:hypothetical protein|nr:hypothetical protein [Verrucomicrobiae bacterium]